MKKFLGLFLFWTASLSGIQILPWVDYVLQPVGRLGCTGQHFRQIDCHGHRFRYPGNDLLLDAWLFFAPSQENAFEMEALITRTHKHSLAVNGLKQAYSYIYMNDSVGDWISLSSGFSLRQNFKVALKDISIINHGTFEAEWNLRLGKEWSEGEFRQGRVFGLIAYGIANRGYHWLRSFIACEYAICSNQTVLCKLEGEGGLGEQSLCHLPFRGYGRTAYRLLDVSLKYTYQTDQNGSLSLTFLQRLACRNAPYAIQRISLEWEYPFNL